MSDEKITRLFAMIEKLYRRGADSNIQKIFEKTHSADIAAVLQGFAMEERLFLFELEISLEKRSEILSYLESELQTELINNMDRDSQISILKFMESDDVADIMGALETDLAQKILQSMEREESEDLANLMGHANDSAGGIMNNDFFALPKELSVEEAIKAIQEDRQGRSILFYIYVVNKNSQLIGVLSLKELLLSKKKESLEDLMNPDVISAPVGMDQEEVAKKVERYDFLSLPVVDEGNKLVGVVTVDDVIDVIRAEAEEEMLSLGQAGVDIDASLFEQAKSRLPWLSLVYLGGILCFLLIYLLPISQILFQSKKFLDLFAHIPLILAMVAFTGNQSVTISQGVIRAERLDKGYAFGFVIREFYLSLFFSLLFSGLTFLIQIFFHIDVFLVLTLSFILALQIIVSMLLGSVVPQVVNRMGFNPASVSTPVLSVLADVFAIVMFFIMLSFVSSWM